MKAFKLIVTFLFFTIAFTNLVAQVNLDSALIGYWPLNGNANDESGNGNDGTVNGATLTTDRFDNPDSAYFFGTNKDIRISNYSFFNNMNQFSISLWIYPTQVNTYNFIFSKANPNRDFTVSLANTKKINVHFYTSGTYYNCTSKKEVPLNSWTHIVAIWTGLEWQIYLNGELDNTQAHPGVAPPWTGTRMGIGTLDWWYHFTGKIDEVRLYNRVLTDEEIRALYDANVDLNVKVFLEGTYK